MKIQYLVFLIGSWSIFLIFQHFSHISRKLRLILCFRVFFVFLLFYQIAVTRQKKKKQIENVCSSDVGDTFDRPQAP